VSAPVTDPLANLYQELILDHAKRRVGAGVLEHFDATHHELNPTCGDEITVQVAFEPGSDVVAAVAWQGNGCSISMASASVISEIAPGKTFDELHAIIGTFREMLRSKGVGEPDEDVLGDAIAFHGVSKFIMRVKCAMLAWVAIEATLPRPTPAP